MNDWRKSCRRIMITVAIIYVLFCAVVFACQRSLLFIPTRIPVNVIESVAREHGFAPWKNATGQIIGWKIPATGSNAIGSVLIVHGNAGCAVGRDYIARPIHEATNVDVFVLEYPGYGAREGAPSKTSMVAAAEDAFALMPSNAPRYIVSESIGAGVAGELARKHSTEVAGLVMFVPYHNLASVAQRHMWFVPAYALLLDRFNPAESLQAYHGPVQFVIAGADEILGADTGKRLSESYAGPKNLQVIPGAGHNDVSAQPAEWWRGVFGFLQSKG